MQLYISQHDRVYSYCELTETICGPLYNIRYFEGIIKYTCPISKQLTYIITFPREKAYLNFIPKCYTQPHTSSCVLE